MFSRPLVFFSTDLTSHHATSSICFPFCLNTLLLPINSTQSQVYKEMFSHFAVEELD